MKIGYINGLFRRQYAKFFRRKSAVPGYVGEHFFGRLAGKTPYGGAHRGAKRKDA